MSRCLHSAWPTHQDASIFIGLASENGDGTAAKRSGCMCCAITTQRRLGFAHPHPNEQQMMRWSIHCGFT
eukprot:5881663-Pleurochrysis_carterae.AAC.8